MKCDICEQEKEKVIPFYWGFFKTSYEPEKWINACEKCCRRFQKASHLYAYHREELLNLEQEIKFNVEKKKEKVKTRTLIKED